MQFHLNGVTAGDPSVAEAIDVTQEDRNEVDVLIVGCGPAGLTLAAQLSAFPEISVRILERKSGPLQIGQADGIACRSIEMFEAFGFSEKVIKEGYWVNEVAFWRPDPETGKLMRADRIQDVEDDLSEMPHVILSQARVHDFFLEMMWSGPRRLTPDYDRALVDVAVADQGDHPVTATFQCLDAMGETETIKARYIVGCDGARSTVRRSMGHALKGEAARQLWGVMDVLLDTDFPDIRLKVAIQSAQEGSVLIIPREGGYLVRLYIELDELAEGERAADRQVTQDMLVAKARAIFAPYRFDVRQIAWWSAYEIGQRVCDAFDDVPDDARKSRGPRMFIAGDACHTHSPKAGQGMNVSMADAFNLGWKLAAVLRGQSDAALLHSYSSERRAKARELIEFDKDMARLFSAKPSNDAEAALFQQYFKKHGRYTAGVETQYAPSVLTGSADHQALAEGLVVGMRFHSAPVIRLADAKPMHLAHVFKADGRWRLVAFAPIDDDGSAGGAVDALCTSLGAPDGLVRRVTPVAGDIDSVIDLRAVFQKPHRDMNVEGLPALLLPSKGRFGLRDYEKAFCPSPRSDIFDMRGIDRRQGAVVVVRPDQYVSAVLPLLAVHALSAHFKPILQPAIG